MARDKGVTRKALKVLEEQGNQIYRPNIVPQAAGGLFMRLMNYGLIEKVTKGRYKNKVKDLAERYYAIVAEKKGRPRRARELAAAKEMPQQRREIRASAMPYGRPGQYLITIGRDTFLGVKVRVVEDGNDG